MIQWPADIALPAWQSAVSGSTISHAERTDAVMTETTHIFFESWGAGAKVVLVHGSLATGAEEWQEQRPLANEGFRLLAMDRRGYGRSPAADGEDFLHDAADVAELMGEAAHLVGHSYGGLGALYAAARRPEATLSLTLLEPGAFALGQSNPSARALVHDVRSVWDEQLPDDEWVLRFLQAVGTDAAALPPEVAAALVALTPVVRRGRPIWQTELPLAELAAADVPEAGCLGWPQRGVRSNLR